MMDTYQSILLWFSRLPSKVDKFGSDIVFSQKTWGEHCVDAAEKTLGWGESGGNNQGVDLDILRRGRVLLPGQGGEWCSTAASYWCEEGYALAQGFTEWTWLTDSARKACPVKRSPGAAKFVRGVAKAGSWVTEPRRGDFVLWKRKGGHHVGLFESGTVDKFYTYEGNKGRYNPVTKQGSKIRLFLHEFGEPELVGFARLPEITR